MAFLSYIVQGMVLLEILRYLMESVSSRSANWGETEVEPSQNERRKVTDHQPGTAITRRRS